MPVQKMLSPGTDKEISPYGLCPTHQSILMAEGMIYVPFQQRDSQESS